MKQVKEIIRELDSVNTIACLLFSYLFSLSDTNGIINVNVDDLAIKFSTNKTNIISMLLYMKHKELAEGLISVSNSDENDNIFIITFTTKKKVVRKAVIQSDVLFKQSEPNIKKFLIQWYKKKDFEYNDFINHTKYIKTISKKLILSMKSKNMEITETSIEESFKTLFNNLPTWWIKNSAIRLPSISKNFDKITNQIRNEKSTSKDHRFHAAISQTQSTDYSDIIKK